MSVEKRPSSRPKKDGTRPKQEGAALKSAARASSRSDILIPVPIPHEHGAWAMLYIPLVIALGGTTPFRLIPSLFLFLGVTSAFFAQSALEPLLRGKAPPSCRFWIAVYTVVFSGAALALVLVYALYHLIMVGFLALTFAGWYMWMIKHPSGKRQLRSETAEILTVCTLSLTAPAGVIVSRGSLDSGALVLWGANILYFCSAIFYLKMLLGALRYRKDFSPKARWKVGWPVLVYHATLVLLVGACSLWRGGLTGGLLALAYLPVVARSGIAFIRLTPSPPPLKQVGWREAGLSIWFAICMISALRVG